MLTPELLPCPFCGEKPHVAGSQHPAKADLEAIDCVNEKCAVQPELDHAPWPQVVETWNTRAPHPAEAERDAALARVKELEEALRPFVDALELTHRDFGVDPATMYETANCVQCYLKMQHFASARTTLGDTPND